MQGKATLQRIEALTGGLQSEVARLLVTIQNQTGDALNLGYRAKRKASLSLSRSPRGIVFQSATTNSILLGASLTTGPHRPLVANLTAGRGTFYNGDREIYAAQWSGPPVPRFRALVNYTHNDIDLPQGRFVRRLVRLGMDVIYSATSRG